MSAPKAFLEPDDVYARIKELERVVKALHTTPRTLVTGLQASEVATTEGSLPIDASWHDLATVGPTVTVTTGSSGIVVVMAACNVGINCDSGGAGGCNLGISVDGATPALADRASAQFTGVTGFATLVSTISMVRLYTLSALASHTCKLKYQNLSGTGETWFNRSLVAIPI